MSNKKIAFFVNGLYGGGAEKVLQVLLQHIDRNRYDITLYNHKEEVVNKLYPSDITYKSILKSHSCWGKIWIKLYNKINLLIYENFSPQIFRQIYIRERFDIEIAFIEGYATRIVSGGRSKKKITWVHTDLEQNPWTDIAYRTKEEQSQCYLLFDSVISVSQSVKQVMDKLFPSIKNSIVAYNPIDSERIKEISNLFSPDRNWSIPLFCTVGRLVPQKGYDRLIPIVGKLIQEGFIFQLWIIGEGEERIFLEKLIHEWNLENIVILYGFISNPYPYMAIADWFVCSSQTEGYSTVVTESYIVSTPVITTECAGMNEILNFGEYGILVKNSNDDLLNGIRNILKNKSLTYTYKNKALMRSNDFSLKSQMDNIYKIIEE